ncbi:MAG: hypothetical protein QXP16_01620 [Candidatus Bathyarchaeia archaeon]
MPNGDLLFKAKLVQLIITGQVDEALSMLSRHYGVDSPHLKVGMPKGHSGKAGCYVPKTETIHIINHEKIRDPFIILHEFYHHLRTFGGKHKGTEKNADKFAKDFIEAYRNFANVQ